jgi:hypothetical protein
MTRDRVNRTASREALRQALQTGQQISQRASSGKGFDPRGGVGVLAAQLATAGIGAFAQNRARKQLAELEQQEQQAFATQFPQFAGLASQTTPETRQAAIQAQLGGQIKQQFATPKQPDFQIKESEQGFVRINPQTGEAFPITTGDQPLKGKPSKPLVEVKTGELETQFQKERGRGKAARLGEIIEAGDKSTSFERNIDVIESALDEGAFVGPGATKIATINEISSALGLPAGLEKAANTRVIEQRLNDLTLEATGKLKGAISEKELDLAKKTIFDLGTSETATRKALKTLRALSRYDQQLSDLASSLEDQGRFTSDFRKEKRVFDKEFRKNFLQELKEPVAEPAQGNIKFIGFE